MFETRKSTLYVILAGIFITNAVVAELIGSKLIFVGPVAGFGPYLMSIGVVPWPVVFVTTDLINEYFGRKGVQRLSVITAGLIAYCFVLLYFAMKIPAAKGDGWVTDAQFDAIFGQSQLIIIGSITAFIVSQIIDVTLFHFFKKLTGERMIWLRSTGSTVISQLFDSFIVLGIAFYLSGKMTFDEYMMSGITNYSVKLVIAILMTPFIYLGHWIIEKYVHEHDHKKQLNHE